ncbi:TolC family protein, partial [Acinetobacter baumannii]
AANIAISIAEANVIAEVKVRYFNVLRREQEVIAAREDKALTEQIRDRVKVRVETGESARFDLIRADTEVANAAKQLDSAILRLL